MAILLIASRLPLAGKTTVAVGLARYLSQMGKRVALLRLADDEAAELDAAFLASLPFNRQRRPAPLSLDEAAQVAADADVAIHEAPAGDLTADLRANAAHIIVVARYGELEDSQLAAFCLALGEAFLGVVATAVPRRRLEPARRSLAEAALLPLALIPEDRILASLTVSELAEALDAHTLYLDDRRQQVLDRILISSISADPGQGYFARYNPKAVIVRSDKPDLQLAALNASAPCLILTGGLQPLSYVLQRAEEEGIPLLLTQHDTVTTISLLEQGYSRTRFRGQAKVEHSAQLMAETLDAEALGRALETK